MKYFILLFTLLFHTLVYSQLNTSNRTVNQKLYFKAGANFDSLTADRPAYIDSSGDIVSQLLDLTTDVTGVLPLANGGTGSATQNFVDLTTNQSIAGQKTFTDDTTIDASGSGDALTITHSGSGDGLSINHSGAGVAATITGTLNVTGQVSSDNLNLNGNTVSSTDTNGNIILDPNGTGNVNLPDLTISQPAYIDASGNLVSQDLSLTADVSGILPEANGGTGLDASAVTDGQLLIGNTSDNTFDLATITGTTDQVSVSNGNGSITLATPQDIATTSSPTFAGVTSTGDILMSGTGQIDLPVGTTAQRSGSPNSGMLRFNSETSQFEGYDGSAWGEIGGAGGGGGGLDIFYNQDHETDVDSSDYTTGLNATFDNGGTLGGALANETTNPIAGATSVKYTTSATATNSTNDWFASASITLDDKQKGNFVGFNFFYTWSGSDDLLCVVVWDDTNDTVLNDSTDCLEAASNPTRYSLGVFIPTSTNAIKLGFHHTGASESSKVLVFDDIELSSNPFVYKNLGEENVYSAVITAAGNVTSATPFKGSDFIATADVSLTDTSLYTIDISSLGLTQSPSAVSKAIIDVTGLTGTRMSKVQSVSATEIVVRTHAVSSSTNNSVSYAAYPFTLMIQRQGADYVAPAEHVVTPAKSGIETYRANISAGYATGTKIIYFSSEKTNTISQTGTVTNNGTSGFTFTANKKVIAFLSAGTARGGAGDVRWGWVLNPTNDNTDIASQDERVIGGYAQQTSTGSDFAPTSTMVVLEKDDVVKFMGSGNTLSPGDEFGVSIVIVDFEQQVLSAVPVPLVAILKDVKPSGTAGGTFTSGAWRTRTLNTVEGDSEIVSLSSNEFTLQRGKYIIEGMAPALMVDEHKTRIYDVTNSAEAIIGSSAYASAAFYVYNKSNFFGVIEISSPTTYRLEHRSLATKTSNGFGVATSFGSDEVFATVKITKLK